jgi:hypothetical protein
VKYAMWLHPSVFSTHRLQFGHGFLRRASVLLLFVIFRLVHTLLEQVVGSEPKAHTILAASGLGREPPTPGRNGNSPSLHLGQSPKPLVIRGRHPLLALTLHRPLNPNFRSPSLP